MSCLVELKDSRVILEGARFRTCRYNTCSAENRCDLCALNPKRRCAEGIYVAHKQTEQTETIKAPCEAPLKVALHAIEQYNAQSSSNILDLAGVFLEVRLV